MSHSSHRPLSTWLSSRDLDISRLPWPEIIGDLSIAVYVCDAQGRIVSYNQAAVDLWGRAPKLNEDQWSGSWCVYANGATPGQIHEQFMPNLVEETSVDGQAIIVERPDGTRRVVLPHPQPLRDSSAVASGTINLLVDITERYRQDAVVAGQMRALEAVVNGASLRDVLELIVKTAESITLHQVRAAIMLVDRSAKRLVLAAGRNLPNEFREALQDCPPAWPCGTSRRAVESGVWPISEDFACDPAWSTLADIARRNGIHSSWSTPIVSAGGQTVGSLDLYASRRPIIESRDQDLLQLLARTAALLIEREHEAIESNRARQAQQDSERRFATFMRHLPGAAWIKDAQGCYVYANPQAKRIFGVLDHQLFGHTDQEIFPPATADQFRHNDRLAISGGIALQTVEILRQPDGEIHHSLVSKFPMPQADDSPTFVGGIAFDISDRVRAEASLRASDVRMRTLLALLPAGVYACDAEGRMTFYNRRAAELWGYEPTLPEKLPRFGPTCNVYSVDGTPLSPEYTPMAIALSEGRSFRDVEMIVERRSGGRFVAAVSIDPIYDVDGKLIGAINVFQDISERKRAENALLASEARFHNMADASPALVWISGTDKQCTWLNRPWLEFTGCTMDQGSGEGWIAGIHPKDRDQFLQTYHRAFDARENFRIEHRLRRHDGEYRWLLNQGVPLIPPDGEFVGYIGSCIDITEEKTKEAELREAHRRKDEFLAILGHELRNPLAGIVTGAQVLGMLELPDQARQMQAIIARQSTYMSRIIDDLLDVSRIAQGRLRLRLEPIDLVRLLQETVEDFRQCQSIDPSAVRLTIPDRAVWISGDAARLCQALSNLLQNAWKFCDGPNVIQVIVSAEEGLASVVVRDQGIGMTEATLAQVFEPFNQADTSLDRSRGGLGLGLALVKGIVDLHGGSVRGESHGMGHGSTFEIKIPTITPPSPTHQSLRVSTVIARRVLLIDDRRDAILPLQSMLEILGHSVQTASDGRSGLEVARRCLPDVIFCDIGLAGDMNGYDVGRAIRATPELAKAYLVAVTGYGKAEDRLKTKDAGFDHHLTKPVSQDDVSRLLAQPPRFD